MDAEYLAAGCMMQLNVKQLVFVTGRAYNGVHVWEHFAIDISLRTWFRGRRSKLDYVRAFLRDSQRDSQESAYGSWRL